MVDHVLTEWDIEPSKIIASLTDNGSNMVAAFRKKVEANVCGQEGEDEEEEEEVIEEDSKATVDETLDFDCQEMSHQIAFGSLNHVSCFAHSLQLVVNKFSGITAFQPILKRTHTVQRKVNASVRATERLITLSGRNWLKSAPLAGAPHFS